MIGIFDSGLGGLTVFRELEKVLPTYDYMYLGDNARAPYGDHSQETILKYTQEALTYLFDQGCILVLVACNTASAEALPYIQQKWLPKQYPGKNVLGVIRPLVEEASKVTQNKLIGVLATRSTVASNAYVHEFVKLDKEIKVSQQACRLLVPLIEEGMEKHSVTKRIIKKYTRPLKHKNIDTVILGCTHYGLIAEHVKHYFGSKVNILDSGAIIATKFADYLTRHPEYENQISKKSKRIFATTENVEAVESLIKKFLGREITISKVNLTDA